MSVEPLEMLCAEAVDALPPRVGDLRPESLASDVPRQEVKFVLKTVCLSLISLEAWPDLD